MNLSRRGILAGLCAVAVAPGDLSARPFLQGVTYHLYVDPLGKHDGTIEFNTIRDAIDRIADLRKFGPAKKHAVMHVAEGVHDISCDGTYTSLAKLAQQDLWMDISDQADGDAQQ